MPIDVVVWTIVALGIGAAGAVVMWLAQPRKH